MLTQDAVADSLGQSGGAAVKLLDGNLNASFVCHDDPVTQSSLHFNTQTILQASDAKSFAMKKSLADQVRAYLEHRGEGYTPAKLATEVARLQRDLPEADRCKRQNIEQLLEKEFRTVRYLPALAQAMGTTVEALSAGLFVPGAAPPAEAPAAAPAQVTEYLPGFEHLAIPLLANSGSMGAGEDQLHDEVVVGRLMVSPQWVQRTIKPLTKPENLRFIHGWGDSMDPTFCDGDILLVDAGVQTIRIDGIYVLEANDRIYIKRVRQRMDGNFEVSSDNSTVKTVDVLDGSRPINVRGRVVWCWNGKKM